MNIRYLISAAMVAAMVTAVQVKAEQQSTTDEVKTWSKKQWRKARATFVKDKEKWADCRRQNKEMKLKGKESWSFLYGCMKA